jgi:hypothetical protein
MIRWVPPGPYEVVFSTRAGGVSQGPYDSLNLGRMTGDDVERVDENRRRLCAGSARLPTGLRSTGRSTPPSSIEPSPERAASLATGSGLTSRTCRCSR